jgi:uncharacterized membrane-anchored protein
MEKNKEKIHSTKNKLSGTQQEKEQVEIFLSDLMNNKQEEEDKVG